MTILGRTSMGRANTFHEVLEPRQDEATISRMWQGIEARRKSASRDQRGASSAPAPQSLTESPSFRRLAPLAPSRAQAPGAASRSGWRRVALYSAAAVLVAAIILGVFQLFQTTTDALTLSSHQGMPENVAINEDTRFEFTDGSTIDATAQTRFDVLVNRSDAIEFALREGKMTFDVVPGGPRRWTIHSGAVDVVVVGTKFTVQRAPENVFVSVERGKVLVKGAQVPDGVQKLTASKSILVMNAPAPATPSLVPAKTGRTAVRQTEEPVTGDAISFAATPQFSRADDAFEKTASPKAMHCKTDLTTSHPAHIADARSHRTAPMSSDEILPLAGSGAGKPRGTATDTSDEDSHASTATLMWKQSATAGNYTAAYNMLPAFTFSRLNTPEWSVSDLFLLSDVARATHHYQQACKPLEEIVRRSDDATQTGLAAYSLAGLSADVLNQPLAGAAWYEQSLNAGLSRALQETALFRLIQIYEKHSPQKAMHFSDVYLREYPGGKHSVQINQIRSRVAH